MNEFAESLFNLDPALLLRRYKDVDEAMIKRLKQLWVAPRLPIAPYCVLEKLYFVWGSESTEGTGMSRDILFPEGKMFLSFLVCPGVLPTALEKLEGHDC